MSVESIAHPARQAIGIRWIILGLIVAASFASYLLRTNLSIVGETMITDLGMSEFQLGMVFSAFAAGYAIFQFPGGIFGDKIGPRLAITIIAIGWGVLTIVTGLIPGSDVFSVTSVVVTLIVVRFLVGAFHAPIFPVTGAGAISNWFPVGGWGLPNGLSSTGLTLGAAATAPVVVWLMDAFGWRQSFFFTAPVAFLIAAVWWWYVRDYPKQHHHVGERERELIDAGRPAPESAQKEKGTWKLVLKNRDIQLLTVSYFCMNYVFYLFFNWFFFYLVDVRGFGAHEAGSLTAAQWIVGAIGATLGGLTCDRIIRRLGLRWGSRMLPLVGLTLCAVFLYAGASAADPYLTVVFLVICFGCTQVTEAAYWSAAIAVAGRHAAAAGGVMNTGGNVVGFIGGMLVPFTASHFGWDTAIATGSIFALIGALLWLFVRADRPMVISANP